MVIRTADNFGAGTDDFIKCIIDGSEYDLEDLYASGAPWYESRNEQAAYDGYNLTPRLNALYPDGITVGDLMGKTYTVEKITPWVRLGPLSSGNWKVESVAIYINDQLLCAHNYNKWLQTRYFTANELTLTGTFTQS